MTTYGLTDDGFIIKPRSVIIEDVENYQRANIDELLDFDEGEDISQINISIATEIYRLWELGQAIYASFDPDSNTGAAQDSVAAITGTVRSVNKKTTVAAQVTLNPYTSLPVGAVANPAGRPNDRFVNTTEVPPDPAGGTFDADFEAEEVGPTIVTSGQLTEITEEIEGWTAVTNAADGITGSATETDEAFRVKREVELEAAGSTNIDAIRANGRQLSGVVDVSVFENTGSVPDLEGRQPNTVHAVFRGGDTAEIAEMIYETKAGGAGTHGDEINTVYDTEGKSHEIRHDFSADTLIYVETTVRVDPLAFDSVNGPADIKAQIIAYINSLSSGATIVRDKAKAGIFLVVGTLAVPTFLLDIVDPPTGETDLTLAIKQHPNALAANIDVTVTVT
jgi:uncharacterized phage protein gp47/JayE